MFKIWDEDGSGELDLEEVTIALVSLGLSTDRQFVHKLLTTLDVDLEKGFTLKDFVKIFKADKVGDRIVKVLKKDASERKNQ